MKGKNNKTNIMDNPKTLIAIIIAVVVVIVGLLVILLKKDVPEYNITFDSKGGSSVATLVVDENGKIVKPEDPTKEGYVFMGWYLDGELYDFNKPVTGDIALEARWELATDVTGVELDKTELSLKVGEQATLVATVLPENAKDKSLTWESSDNNVATVDQNGNVKAVGIGNATITVTTKEGNFKAQVLITVSEAKVETDKPGTNKPVINQPETSKPEVNKNVKVTGVALNTTALNLEVGASSKLTSTVKPSNATNKNVTWKSSNTNIATVDQNGNVKAVGVGTATITVTTKDGNYTATATVTVKAKPDSYTVTFTEIKQELTGSVLEYSMKVTKNGSSFSNFKGIKYNGTVVKETLAVSDCNKSIKTATIVLSDGSQVTNVTVVYK